MTKPKTVLVIGNFLSSVRGTYGVCEILALKLSQNGWTVITTSRENNRFLRILDMLKVTWQSRDQYSVATIDIFSGPSFAWAEAVSLLLKKLNIPFVVVLHGGNLPMFAKRWPGRVKALLARTNSTITPSHYIASELSWMRPDILILPNALDVYEYPYSHRVQPKPKLAWLRAFHTIYNPDLAVKAIAILVTEFPEIKLVMYGPDKFDGSYKSVESFIETAKISEHVEMPGAIPKALVPETLAQHDIFLNTTTAESFGVAVMEAAALGLCIVTTNVGELPYIWTHNHDALLVPPNNPEAMAQAVARILTEPGLAERLSRNARAKAKQFDWSAILPQWDSLLSDVIERHESRSI